MRRCTLVVLAFLPLMAQAAGPLDKFGWFAQVVGSCWQGTFPDGTTMHSHCYTSQFDQFIRGTATLSADHDGTKEQQFSGDSVFAWNDKAQRITYYIWGSDGSYGQHEAFYDGEDLAFPVYSKKDPSKVAFRSLWHRIDGTSFEVRRQVPQEGGGWKTELTILYRSATLQ